MLSHFLHKVIAPEFNSHSEQVIEQFLQDIFLQIEHIRVHLLQHNLEHDLHLILQFLIQISFKQILHITSGIFFLQIKHRPKHVEQFNIER